MSSEKNNKDGNDSLNNKKTSCSKARPIQIEITPNEISSDVKKSIADHADMNSSIVNVNDCNINRTEDGKNERTHSTTTISDIESIYDMNDIDEYQNINNLRRFNNNFEHIPFRQHHRSFERRFSTNYDKELDYISDCALNIIEIDSFGDCGFYQFWSFLFISVVWVIGNGWYKYSAIFTGYSPSFECANNDKNISLQIQSNSTSLNCDFCNEWKFNKNRMTSTMITEFNLVCNKDYYFEVSYGLEQISFLFGTFVFSYIADLFGRKPVLVGVLLNMSILGIIQYFTVNFTVYIALSYIINTLACVSILDLQNNIHFCLI
jgi:hypothetical protein